MAGLLKLHTDASVIGERLPKGYMQKRRRVGETFVAWAGWHSSELPERPTFAGQAYVGRHGTQRAEFAAVLHGLSGALSYVRSTPLGERPTLILAYVDNDSVYKLMVGDWQPAATRALYEAADDLCARLDDEGVPVDWRSCSESDERHRIVDRMSKLAKQQVLVVPDWRPTDDEPPKRRKPASDDEIPF